MAQFNTRNLDCADATVPALGHELTFSTLTAVFTSVPFIFQGPCLEAGSDASLVDATELPRLSEFSGGEGAPLSDFLFWDGKMDGPSQTVWKGPELGLVCGFSDYASRYGCLLQKASHWILELRQPGEVTETQLHTLSICWLLC
ncbi:unnamed protein product [Effrenium voratum]|uniref:Uncharacterized protein n=1 Tax=Effrenium voratum TaxID=2562239 RepID=A0AA36NK17_9DINO|nr:unnamed protein product [Effrenium voratum]CAJ1410317.1 unnamed protein product [Effrenium voratum]CAJ1459851.1 unnamed protein product [Effrenium voratum]